MEEQENLTRAQNGPVIVTLPPEIDMSNASSVGGLLTKPIEQGVRLLVADMTETVFCDSSGMRNLLLAHNTAVARGADLRLVVPGGAVLQVMEIMGLLGELRVFGTLDAALAADPPPAGPADG